MKGIIIPKDASQIALKLLQPKVLNGILIALICLSIAYLVFLLVHQQSAYSQDVLELTGLKRYLTWSGNSLQTEMPPRYPKSDYDSLANSRFFREPGFVEVKKEEVALTQETAVDLTSYRSLQVMGVIGESQAIIQDPENGSTQYVSEGDQIKGATVRKIQPGKVTLKIGEETVELVF